MNYAVTWTDEALEDFLEIWLLSSEKTALTEAAERIVSRLAKEPFSEKHEVVRGAGIAVDGCLGVDFRVLSDTRIVTVISAWLVP
jgi:hypothetical protein